jgi:hypothetical protein
MGSGSLLRILDCSVEGPRGAKLNISGEADAVGDDGRDGPLPSPDASVSSRCMAMIVRARACTFQKLGQRRIVEYHVLHVGATSSCEFDGTSSVRFGASFLLLVGICGRIQVGCQALILRRAWS